MRIICHFSLKYETFNFIKQTQTDLTAVLQSPCRQCSDNGFKIFYMLWLLVEKPTQTTKNQMLEMLSDIWISICWQHGDNQIPVHLKSLGAFHSLFNKSRSIKKIPEKWVVKYINHQDICCKQSQHILTATYICGLRDCSHIQYTTICHLTALMFITPQCAIWLPSHSLYHHMPPDCLHVQYTTLCCWLPIHSSHHNMSCDSHAFTALSDRRSNKYYN